MSQQKTRGSKLYRDRYLIMLALPALILTILFCYLPMSGIIMAFQNYMVRKGLFGSEWVGLKHFKSFFSSIYAGRVIKNTIVLSSLNLLFGFLTPILFALLLNELRCTPFKRIVQTVSYLPHFVSTVVVVGMLVSFFNPSFGLINVIRAKLGLNTIAYMSDPKWFRPLYVGSEVWQHFGWNSIIYISAMAGIPQEMYEAAEIDGAGRFKQAIFVTVPSLMPTIITLLILNCGWLFSMGYEKVILMYSPSNYEVADIISSYVYRRGILNSEFSFSTAIGLMNSLLNTAILIGVNAVSKKVNGISVF